jgi:ABC-type antimicrobial peptide transport system permease subunit
VILEGRFSDYISIGDNVSIIIGGKNFNLIVAGFYGPSSADISGLPQAQQIRLRLISRSLISESIYSQVKRNFSSKAYLLIKLKPNADVDKVVSEIRSLPGVEWVTSAFEQIKLRSENFLLSGALNISQLGVFFSVIAASIGSALVTLVSLMERRKEITLLMVRGFSHKQVVSILLAESLSTLLLAILVGGFVGYLVHRGNVSSSAVVAGVVTPRIIFPLETIINLTVVFALLASSIIIPAVIMVTLRSNRLVWRE